MKSDGCNLNQIINVTITRLKPLVCNEKNTSPRVFFAKIHNPSASEENIRPAQNEGPFTKCQTIGSSLKFSLKVMSGKERLGNFPE